MPSIKETIKIIGEIVRANPCDLVPLEEVAEELAERIGGKTPRDCLEFIKTYGFLMAKVNLKFVSSRDPVNIPIKTRTGRHGGNFAYLTKF